MILEVYKALHASVQFTVIELHMRTYMQCQTIKCVQLGRRIKRCLRCHSRRMFLSQTSHKGQRGGVHIGSPREQVCVTKESLDQTKLPGLQMQRLVV